MSSRLPSNWTAAIEWQLGGVLVPPDIDVIARVDTSSGRRTPIDESRLSIDGLIAARFEFAGPASPNAEDSALKSSDAPRADATPLGIDTDKLVPVRSE
jgi:hypothetical protein